MAGAAIDSDMLCLTNRLRQERLTLLLDGAGSTMEVYHLISIYITKDYTINKFFHYLDNPLRRIIGAR